MERSCFFYDSAIGRIDYKFTLQNNTDEMIKICSGAEILSSNRFIAVSIERSYYNCFMQYVEIRAALAPFSMCFVKQIPELWR